MPQATIRVTAEGEPRFVGYCFREQRVVELPVGAHLPTLDDPSLDLHVDLATDERGRARGVFFTQPSADGGLRPAFVDLGKRPLNRVSVVPEAGYREVILPVEVAHTYVVKTRTGRAVALVVKSLARARDGASAAVSFDWDYVA